MYVVCVTIFVKSEFVQSFIEATFDNARNTRKEAGNVRFDVIDPQKPSRGLWIEPAQAPQYSLKVPHPLVETGIITMGSRANPWLLWAAVLIFPVTVIICSLRWHALLGALDIHIPRSRAFVITMVGQFYSSFLPGSTGGDVPKAFYAAKQTSGRAGLVTVSQLRPTLNPKLCN